MPSRITLLTLLALVFGAWPMMAQDPYPACTAFGKPTVGQWSEYRVAETGGAPLAIRFAIVGRETRQGKPLYWFEFKANTPHGTMVRQTLIPDFPFEREQVRDIVMKAGDQPARRIDPARLRQMLDQAKGVRGPTEIDRGLPCRAVATLGWESVTVPAGTFRGLHVKLRDAQGDTDAWLSPGVPFGMIKIVMGQTREVTLTALGKDAVSSIREKPQPAAAPGSSTRPAPGRP